MAIDQIDESLLNELRIGSVPTAEHLEQMPQPGQLPQQAASGPATGHLGQGFQDLNNPQTQQQLTAPKMRPTFMSAFLANLGPALAGGMARSTGKGGFAGGIAQGVGGGAEGIVGEQHYQQQFGLEQQKAQSEAQYKQALAGTYTPTVVGQDASGNPIYGLAPRYAAQANVAGIRAGGQEQSAAIRAEGAQNVAQTNVSGRKDVANIQAGTAAKGLAEKTSEFRTTDQYKRWKTQLDDDTKIKVAQLTQSKAPAAVTQSAIFAQGGIQEFQHASTLMDDMEKRGVLGQNLLTNKTEDYLFGKGLADPSWDSATRFQMGKLRDSLALASSAMLRAHTGRTSQDIYNDFKKTNNLGQDWSALRGAMEESTGLLQHYVDAASNQNILNLRTGNANEPAAPAAKSNSTNADPFAQFGGKRHGGQ